MSDEIIIRSEGLGKKYVIGHQLEGDGYLALRDVIARTVKSAARKTVDVFRGRSSHSSNSKEEFWALKDVSFEVKRGEVLGIIGRNGAGKSTLLKVLSRITDPTEGRITIRGRVASLLEVGTGFHQELTGRENIFLNGAILGMSRAEIKRKFDEIVAFAEVEKFLDTPVKRYSSGMYVRLAFAVAAHLEPEILVIDEVLAVGDARFQKKSLGRMNELSKGGRTVLFVSHNMAMISSLCSKALHLEAGRVVSLDTTDKVILNYSNSGNGSPTSANYRNGRAVGDEHVQLLNADVRNAGGQPVSEIEIDQPFTVRIEYRILRSSHLAFVPNFHFHRQDGTCAFIVNATGIEKLPTGDFFAECHFPANFLNDGLYSVQIAMTSFESGVVVHINESDALLINVRDPIEGILTRASYSGAMPGAVRPLLPWTIGSAVEERR
jgi:lipopolysaccharide transport system ATP-binding protein